MATAVFVLVYGPLAWTCGEVHDQQGEEHLTGQSSSQHKGGRGVGAGGGYVSGVPTSVHFQEPNFRLPISAVLRSHCLLIMPSLQHGSFRWHLRAK